MTLEQRSNLRIYDAHCHLHEFSDEEIREFASRGYVIIAVSDDLRSSIRTLDIYERYKDSVVPCVGVHPWNIEKEARDSIERTIEIIRSRRPPCIGEVGVDKRFMPHSSFDKQVEILSMFLREAVDLNSIVNIHAIDAWRDALNLVKRAGISKAIFHWYNGPDDVLREIQDMGYMVSINAAIKIQEKHRKIAKIVDLENMLIESDGPYNYRGLRLSPHMLEETISIIAELKGLDPGDVWIAIERNYKRYIG
jgi:TatD DNase family protein